MKFVNLSVGGNCEGTFNAIQPRTSCDLNDVYINKSINAQQLLKSPLHCTNR